MDQSQIGWLGEYDFAWRDPRRHVIVEWRREKLSLHLIARCRVLYAFAAISKASLI